MSGSRLELQHAAASRDRRRVHNHRQKSPWVRPAAPARRSATQAACAVTARPKLLTLQDWARATYGDAAPSLLTLRKWARSGNIMPPPRKHGRTYYVQPDAEYVSYFNGRLRLVDRLRWGK